MSGGVMGRPLLLTDELTERLALEVEDGTPLRHAAQIHGVSDATAAEWLARGEDRHPRGNGPEFQRYAVRIR